MTRRLVEVDVLRRITRLADERRVIYQELESLVFDIEREPRRRRLAAIERETDAAYVELRQVRAGGASPGPQRRAQPQRLQQGSASGRPARRLGGETPRARYLRLMGRG